MPSTPALSADYVELRARSAFSFLEGASNPEDLALQAAHLGYSGLALADHGGVYGIPRFHAAAQSVGLPAIVGAEVELELPGMPLPLRLRLLVESARGWRHLSRLLTCGHRGRSKNECRITQDDLEGESPEARPRARFLTRDLPVTQGALLLFALMFVFVNLIVDVLYAYVDPRITYD